MTPRRFALRAATSAAHQALEDQLGQIESPPAYERYLRATSAFRGKIERDLPLNLPDGFQPTRLHEELKLDCVDLGLPIFECTTPARAYSEAAAMGITYVLEGATLGAALLWPMALKLGYHDKFGARHLARQVKGRDNWTAFLALLEARPALNLDEAAEAANAAFAMARAAAREADALSG